MMLTYSIHESESNNSSSVLHSKIKMSKLFLIPQNWSIFLCTKQRKYGKIEIEKTLYEQHPEGEFENAENRVYCKQ